jgi:predicted DNA-binding protein (UPF0251 family)
MRSSRKKNLNLDEIKQIETMSGLGLKVEQMAAILGMSKRTFERRIKDTDGASDALEKGRALAAIQVTKTAFEMAKSGRVPVMTMFWLKCRQNWRDQQHVTIEDTSETKELKERATTAETAYLELLALKLERRTLTGGSQEPN